MKIKDLINELSSFDEDTEVFVCNKDGLEKRAIEIGVTSKFFLDGKFQTVIRLLGSNADKKEYIF